MAKRPSLGPGVMPANGVVQAFRGESRVQDKKTSMMRKSFDLPEDLWRRLDACVRERKYQRDQARTEVAVVRLALHKFLQDEGF